MCILYIITPICTYITRNNVNMNTSSAFMKPLPRAPIHPAGPYVPMRSSSLNNRNTETYQNGTIPARSNPRVNASAKDTNFTPFRRPTSRNTGHARVYVNPPMPSETPDRTEPGFTSLRTGKSDETKHTKTTADKKGTVKSQPVKKGPSSSTASKNSDKNESVKPKKDTKPDNVQPDDIPDDSTVVKPDSPECEMPSFIAHYVMLGCILCGVVVLGVMTYMSHETTRSLIKEFMKKNICFTEGNLEKLLRG